MIIFKQKRINKMNDINFSILRRIMKWDRCTPNKRSNSGSQYHFTKK